MTASSLRINSRVKQLSGQPILILLAAVISVILPSTLFAELPAAAIEAIEQQNWQQVSESLTARIGDESNEPVQYWYGVSQYQLGNYDPAVKHLKLALKANPLSAQTGVYIARCGVALKQPDIAEEVLETFPVDATILTLTGQVWYESAQALTSDDDLWLTRKEEYFTNAANHLRRAILFDPYSVEAHQWLAFSLSEVDQYEQAIQAAQQAAELDAVGWELYALMAECFASLERHAEAALAYEAAAEAAPAMAEQLKMEQGKALCESYQYSRAVEVFKDVLANYPKNYTVRHWLGRAAYGADDLMLALWAFGESRAVDNSFESLAWAGRCAIDLGQYEDAERMIQQAIDEFKAKHSDYLPPWYYRGELGLAQWYLGKRDKAMDNLMASIERRPGNLDYAEPAVYFYWVELKNPQGAIDVFKQVGTHGHPQWALDGLTALLAECKDREAQLAAHAAMADLLEQEGRYHSAYHHYNLAGQTYGRNAKTKAGWAAVHTHQDQVAEMIFFAAGSSSPPGKQDYASFGLGYLWLKTSQPERARSMYQRIRKESMAPSRDAGLLWCAIAMSDPAASQLVDPYTMMGMIANGFDGENENRGYEILAIIPNTPLDNTSPALQPGDVILQVGSSRLDSSEALEAFRKQPVPMFPTNALVRRGEHLFDITVDYLSASQKLPASGEGGGQ